MTSQLRGGRTLLLMVLQIAGAIWLGDRGVAWQLMLAFGGVCLVADAAWIGGKGWASLMSTAPILAERWKKP